MIELPISQRMVATMKTLLIALSSVALSLGKAVAERPNIILINVDDLGWANVAYQGSDYYETPNIDQLANNGVVFTDGYAAAANCAPSRACMLTGQWTPRHGVYTVLSSARGKSTTRKLIPTQNTLHINNEEPTMGDVLLEAGYTTATMGKWHVSKDPLLNGFEINIGGTAAGGPYTGGYHSPFKYPNLEEKKKGVYLTDRLTDEAINYVSKKHEKPYFLYLPYFTVHTPLQGKREKIDYFKKKKAGRKDREMCEPVLAAMISSLDENVGRLLEAVDRSGQREDTVIVFTSDNGGVRGQSAQWPLRAGKGSYYEGGIREPFIISWKGQLEPRKESTPVTHLDLFPTFIELAEVEKPQAKQLDGNSLLPMLKGESPIAKRALYWHFPIYLQGGNKESQDPIFRTRPGSAVRMGDWKLIEYFENGEFELYNLSEDVSEKKNLAKEHPEKFQQLHSALKKWRTLTQAPVPSEVNPEYKVK